MHIRCYCRTVLYFKLYTTGMMSDDGFGWTLDVEIWEEFGWSRKFFYLTNLIAQYSFLPRINKYAVIKNVFWVYSKYRFRSLWKNFLFALS